MNQKTHALAKAYVNFATRNKYKLFFLILVSFISSAVYIANNLGLDNNLSALLPSNTPSVLALNESNERFGSTDKFMVAIQSDDVELVAELQDSVKAKIERGWQDEIINIQIERDNTFFKENALLYLPIEHLERIRDNLEILQSRMGSAFNPLVTDFGDSEEEEEEEELVWFDADIPQELGLPDEAAEAFTSFLEKKDKTKGLASEENGFDPKAVVPEHLKTRLIGQHKEDQTINGVAFVKLVEPSTNLNFTNVILKKSEELIAEINDDFKDKTSREFRLEIVGSYEGLKDIDDMKWDGIISGVVSFSLILVLVIGFFRSFLTACILLGQVIVACTFMLLFTTVFYGNLNPFTLFVAAIILGMGIDFSIHFLGSAQRYKRDKGNISDGLVSTIEHLTFPMSLAAITTIAGLMTLLLADFSGFYEFGVIASIGILFSLLTSILGIPVLLLIVEELQPKFVKQAGLLKVLFLISLLALIGCLTWFAVSGFSTAILTYLAGTAGCFGVCWFLRSMVFGFPEKKEKSVFPVHWSENQILSLYKKAFVAFIVASVGLVFFIPNAEFEHNFRKLRADRKQVESEQPKMHVSTAMVSKRRSSQPAAVLGDTKEELEMLHDSLMARKHVAKDPYLKSFLTLSTFVPPEGKQEERMEMIEEISDLINSRAFDKVKDENKENVDKLRELVKVEPFTPEDIPEWALNLLKEKNGNFGTIGFIYGKYQSWNAKDVAIFQDKYDSWNFGGNDLRVFSSSFIFSDVVRVVKADSMKMALFITIVLALTIALTLRKPGLIIISLISLAGGVLWTTGWMGFITSEFDLAKVGIYNVIVIPTVLGVGIDSTIHLLISFYQDKKKSIRHLVDTTGKMVVASSLTTAAGFIGVLFISHKGMRTIGELAVVGIFSILIVAMIVVPLLSKLMLKEES